MKKSVVVLSGFLVIVAAAGGTYWYYFRDNPLEVRENLLQLKETLLPEESDPVYVTAVSKITGNNAGAVNRYAGVVEPQDTLDVKLESNRLVKDIYVKVGDVVKQGQLLFEYDLSNIEDQLQEENLGMERLKNEARSLEEQINTLEKEKKKASKDNQLSYTIEIETDKMNLKKNEYDQKSQQAKIDRLQHATGNTEVRSEINGVIQKIDTSKMTTDENASVTDTLDDSDYSSYGDSDNSGAFITILSTGSYRVKGKINELNINEIIPGEPVIIRSRMDETVTWTGTMGNVDRENADKDNDDNMFFGMSSADPQTTSSTYPFYVELESSDGLMLGQHVYIEPDNGQEDQKTGLWLSEFYIVDADTAAPYVWAANAKNRLEKREIVLGAYDEILGEYEILSGLSQSDFITYPEEELEEGMRTVVSDDADFDEENFLDMDDEEYLDDEDWDSYDEDDDFSGGLEELDDFEDLEDLDAFYEEAGDDEEIVEEFYIDEDGNEVPITEDTPRYLYEDDYDEEYDEEFDEEFGEEFADEDYDEVLDEGLGFDEDEELSSIEEP